MKGVIQAKENIKSSDNQSKLSFSYWLRIRSGRETASVLHPSYTLASGKVIFSCNKQKRLSSSA